MAANDNKQQPFSMDYTIPSQAESIDPPRDIDEIGEIGIQALSQKGFFTRIVVQESKLKRKLLNPKRVRILIIEDDESMAALIEKAMHTFGCQTRVARNRQEIVEALRAARHPHLVLLDVVMPDVSGFDVLSRIRQHPTLKSLPVLMLTALADRDNVVRGLSLGASGYITKPVLPSALLSAVEAVLAD
jgi:two-component system, OmpR family, response regulator